MDLTETLRSVTTSFSCSLSSMGLCGMYRCRTRAFFGAGSSSPSDAWGTLTTDREVRRQVSPFLFLVFLVCYPVFFFFPLFFLFFFSSLLFPSLPLSSPSSFFPLESAYASSSMRRTACAKRPAPKEEKERKETRAGSQKSSAERTTHTTDPFLAPKNYKEHFQRRRMPFPFWRANGDCSGQ